MQGIKAAIYAYYGVTSDPASHSALDGEDKLCMKGKSCVSTYVFLHINLLHTCVVVEMFYA